MRIKLYTFALNSAMIRFETRPALMRVHKLQRQSKWALLATYLPTYVQEHNELHFVM